jgi:molybdopterin converting factor small subunit
MQDPDAVAKRVAGLLGRRHFEDSLGACVFTTGTTLENLSMALGAVTGWSYSKDEAIRFGRRVAAILRAFNLRCGIGPELEYPSARYGSTPHDGPTAGIATRPHWEHMLDVWYAEVGYDRKTGRPLPRAAAAARARAARGGSLGRRVSEAVTLEAYAWVNRLVGGDGTGCVSVEEPARPGDRVRDVLRRLGERYPELGAALWARGPGELAEYFAVMVNGRALGRRAPLEVALHPGDTLALLGQYAGGRGFGGGPKSGGTCGVRSSGR